MFPFVVFFVILFVNLFVTCVSLLISWMSYSTKITMKGIVKEGNEQDGEVSMHRECINYTLQINPWQREEETPNTNSQMTAVK